MVRCGRVRAVKGTKQFDGYPVMNTDTTVTNAMSNLKIGRAKVILTMTKRQQSELSQRRELQSAGWDVNQKDSVAFNSGSETQRHAFCKLAVAWVLKERGYRIDSEVTMDNGEVDILAYGREDGDIIAVECETSPTKEVVRDKIDRYVSGQPVRECFVLTVNDMPNTIQEAVEWARGEL
jgi:hypothetical protein